MTVRELIEIWLTSSDFKVSTTQSHRHKLNTRVLRDNIPGKFDSLADLRVAEIDRDRIKVWWSQVVAEWPTQKSTNSSAYKRLHTAFEYATEELRLISENPVKIKGAGRAPRPESRDRALISLEQAKALTENAPARLRVGTQLLLWSGLRIGELLDLRRKDVMVATAGTVTIRIRRNAQRITDEETGKQIMVSLETPKTGAGNRDIVLPNTVGKALKEHLEEHVGDSPEALIITTMTGAQMMDTNFRNRFATAAELAGRPDITPHDCRRFYGTRLVSPSDSGGSAPVSLEEARRLMGHETVEQLLEYQRAADGYEGRAAIALDSLMTEPTTEPQQA